MGLAARGLRDKGHGVEKIEDEREVAKLKQAALQMMLVTAGTALTLTALLFVPS